MGFECLNCPFHHAPSVHVRVDKLVVQIIFFDTGNEIIGDFIVQSVEDGFDACICESLVACIATLDQVICLHVFDWTSKDCIGVAITECEDVAVALCTLPRKHA